MIPPPLRKLLATALISAVVASCGSAAMNEMLRADSDPHPGVARAHALPVQGIDISKYQGDIDWNRVRKEGIRFAYLKVSEGGDHVDHLFYDNWAAAAAAGIPRGAYHFMYWCRTASEQAVWFTQAVPQDASQLPPVLDLEWNNASPTCSKHIPRDDALAKIKKMLEIMEYHTGKRPVIYTDINFHRDILAGEFKGYDFWLRSVAAEPHTRYSDRKWTFWQYTATGRVAGVKGDVDRNAFHGSEREWTRWLASQGVGS
jgi:lysozyme